MKRVLQKNTPDNQVPKIALTDNFSGGLMHSIHMVYISIQKHLESVLGSKRQISFSQFVILAGFSKDHTSCITQVKLAEHLMLTEATVSRHITTLVSKGFLLKEKAIDNKKIFNLSLTKEGLEAFLAAKKIIMNELDVLFSHISDKDKTSLIKNFTTTISLLHQKK